MDMENVFLLFSIQSRRNEKNSGGVRWEFIQKNVAQVN